MNNFNNEFKSALRLNNLEINCDLIKNINEYQNFLMSENKKYNLTSIVSQTDLINKHFIDSIFALNYFENKKRINLLKDYDLIIDYGSGAGFPLLPWLIYSNHKKEISKTEYLINDSNNKKINFIKNLLTHISIKFESKLVLSKSRIEELKLNNYEKILLVGRAIQDIKNILKNIKKFVLLNNLDFIDFVYLVGPSFECPSELFLKKIFNIQHFSIFNELIKYKLNDNKVDRGIFYFKVEKLTQIRR
tara:strand:- start:1870 stop:2610 length:741 start_codon:yes stop_codon:yes gene_type:complete